VSQTNPGLALITPRSIKAHAPNTGGGGLQVLWDALTVHVSVAEEAAEVARKAERAAQLTGAAGTAAAMAAARAAATTCVLERLSGSAQLVLERAWGSMHRLAAVSAPLGPTAGSWSLRPEAKGAARVPSLSHTRAAPP
jgi:hypothetical protein